MLETKARRGDREHGRLSKERKGVAAEFAPPNKQLSLSLSLSRFDDAFDLILSCCFCGNYFLLFLREVQTNKEPELPEEQTRTMLRQFLLLIAITASAAFAPGSTLPAMRRASTSAGAVSATRMQKVTSSCLRCSMYPRARTPIDPFLHRASTPGGPVGARGNVEAAVGDQQGGRADQDRARWPAFQARGFGGALTD